MNYNIDYDTLIQNIKEISPLIHCITNPISINDCANAILALGAKPIMAEHPDEVADITALSSALCLNLGNITDARIKSMAVSGRTACNNNIPIILDVVGITCSSLRYNYSLNLLSEINPTVIKGNLSEIKKLAHHKCLYSGVDSAENTDTPDALKNAADVVCSLSAETGSIIVASGKTDIISDGKKVILINNGSKYMPYITGTGCMLNVIIGTFLSANCYDALDKSVCGTLILGICGEIAEKLSMTENSFSGLGTYHMNLINALSIISSSDIEAYKKISIL